MDQHASQLKHRGGQHVRPAVRRRGPARRLGAEPPGQLLYIKATQGTFADPNRGSASVTGATLAWGYRFRIAGQVGGRTELNYSMFAKNADIPIPPINVTSILFGLTMPLK